MGFQLPQGYRLFGEAVYFLPLNSQKFLVLNLLTPEGWGETESALEGWVSYNSMKFWDFRDIF